jgi:hypothetical protein
MKELQQYSTRVLRDAIGELLVPTEYSLLQVYLVSDVDAALKSQAEEIKRLKDVLEEYVHHHSWCRVNKRTLEECNSGNGPPVPAGLMKP